MDDPQPDPLLLQLLLQLILIMLNAIFACAEIAVISINDAKMERLSKTGNKRAKRLTQLTSQPAKFFATIQVGITLAGFLGSAFAAGNLSARLMNWFVNIGVTLPISVINTISVILITLILSYITLVFGELVPKRIAMRKAEAIGLGLSGMIYAISQIFKPIVWLMTISTNGVLRLLGIDPNAEDEEVTEEEIRIMVDIGSDKGAIDKEEKEFIHNLFNFDDLTVDKIMTHRIDVLMLSIEESDEDWEKVIYENRYAIYPICESTKDNVVGVLYTKDYFRLKDRSRASVMANAVKHPQFIPENVRADTLLHNMKKKRNHFAVIVDEYGGTSGIVTLNDLLEQLVGDIDDDIVSSEEPLIESINPTTWSISGITPLEEVAKVVGIELPIDEYDTFSGMVLGLLGNVPDDGSTPEIEEYGLNIRITSIKDRRIKSAVICKTKTE